MRLLPLDHITGTILGAIIGSFIGISANVIGWWNVLAVSVVLALAVAAIRALRRAAAKHDQIFDEETAGVGPDKGLGPKDFAMDLIPENHKPIDTGDETR